MLQGVEAWGGWARHMGGALQQLARDELGHPTHVVREVSPRNNMFAFFKVGHESFHQVHIFFLCSLCLLKHLFRNILH